MALISGDDGSPRARWSILARPTRTLITPALADPERLLLDLAALEPSFRGLGPGKGWLGPDAGEPSDPGAPFTSGWIGWISYGVGALLEPAIGEPRRSDWPLMVWHRCEGALTHDAATGRWRAVGSPTPIRLRPAAPNPAPTLHASFAGQWQERYEANVARAIEYIRAGDVYQVNLAHTLDGRLASTPRAFSAALLDRAQPWYGAHVEHTDPDGRARAVCSASPELFLEIEPVRAAAPRRVVTRPMKGTLSADQHPQALEDSAKDRAELDMIVDLMRNDLGRACVTGSISVEQRRAIERHAGGTPSAAASHGVWQGVATISGVLRPGTSLPSLLRAVFPPGSITGAPKIRATQIIEQLEDRPRGPYCGCVGYIGDDGRVGLSVAIRTALAERPPDSSDWLVSYSVGAGIVADSDPRREWIETMHKAGVFLGVAADATAGLTGVMIQSVGG